MVKNRIVCLYGGPGTGKSTTCAGLFYKLKLMGLNAEMNREYIKEWVWERREVRPGDQTYFFSKQARKERLYIQEGLDYIVTDSPLILTHFYGLKYDPYEQAYNTSKNMLANHHGYCKEHGYKTEHFFLERVKAYNPAGRNQDEATAKAYDVEIRGMLDTFGIKYRNVIADESAVDNIIRILEEMEDA